MLRLCAALVLAAVFAGRAAGADGPAPRESILVNGAERTFRVHAPAVYDGKGLMPLVFIFHGGGGQGFGMVGLTGMNKAADKNGFLAVYPDGLSRHWNDGRKV